MSRIRKDLWSKLGLYLNEGGHGKEEIGNSSRGEPNVNDEYREAFRTKSYIDICNKVQGQLETRTSLDVQLGQSSSSSSSSLSSPPSPMIHPVHLSDNLLEPRQETLTAIFETSKALHDHFLENYFEISLEAGRICEYLLQNVHQVRANHRAIRYVLKLMKRVPDCEKWTNNQHHTVYRNLASFALRKNPFSSMTPEKFHELHDSHVDLLHQLTSKCRKTKRRTKLIRYMKRALAAFVFVACGGLGIAVLVLAIHSIVGLLAAPGLILGLFLIKILRKREEHEPSRTWLDGVGAQLDVAARGVYILVNDFDTMSRLVQRLHDEMEHRKFVADICVRKGKNEMLKEVVKELEMHEGWFMEQLEELEKQIYLCFLDINRSRRLVVEQMVK
ncbi:hypothetical protein Salat_1242300 [Sesamum alatum]|uniref:Uncharacterized protein n=1 Tax=Sesamum alatum TaxID=300844 RepID=A0AAE1YFV6_9LAMI|nr:hypothetical protein Salat_1242300 [Sesamum alatum]